jgi:hypothetical protein
MFGGATSLVERSFRHLVGNLVGHRNAPLFDTISSWIGSGSGRPVEATLKCRSCRKGRYTPPVHAHEGARFDFHEKGAGQYPEAYRAQLKLLW